MKNKKINNAKVGLFVIAGLTFLILTLYMIGKNRNLLGSSFALKARVTNVNGLVPGNNVRYKGIDVGSVKSIAVENDTAIIVTMLIDQKMKPYIKRNAIASIATDGLMGNKLVNINSQPGYAESVKAGEIIHSIKPVETDEMLRTLNTTNDNIQKITSNLYEITLKLNRSESLWSLLSDTLIALDVKKAVAEFRRSASNAADLTTRSNAVVRDLEQGNGLVKTLFIDTLVSQQLKVSMEQIRHASDQASMMTEHLEHIIRQFENGGGTAALILSDTVLRETLVRSAENIEEGTDRFNQNMEALKHNFFFRRYFKKLQKDQKDQKGSASAQGN